MNRYFLSIILLMPAVCAFAQERKWEHNVYVAGGLLIDREWGKNETGETGLWSELQLHRTMVNNVRTCYT